MFIKTVVLFIVGVVSLGAASPSGSPPAACEDMVPQHGVPEQTKPSPFLASVTPLGGDRYSFQLTSDASMPFRGVFVQVRDANEQILGSFEPEGDVQAIDCIGGTRNAATHTTNNDKTNFQVVWNGAGTTGATMFHYSSCHNGTVFWVKEMIAIP